MAFCTVQDLADFLQIAIPAESAAAADAIREASAAIQNYCRQQLELVEDDIYVLDVDERRNRLFLPELPVVAVGKVEEGGEILVANVDYKLGRHGILYRLGAWWLPGVQTVAVTYDHGYATIPDDLVSVCKRAAARAYQSGLRAAESAGVPGVQAQTLGDYQVQYGAEQSGGGGEGGTLGASAAPVLLPSERRLLARYRLQGA